MNAKSVPILAKRCSMKRLVLFAPYVIMCSALYMLSKELRHIRWAELEHTLLGYGGSTYAVAAVLLLINYVIWSGYDWTALDQLDLKLPYVQIFRTTSVAFPITNLIGYSLITGFAVRVKRYEPLGVSYAQITKLILFNITTWWTGFLFLCGAAIVYSPEGEMFEVSDRAASFVGCSLLGVVAAYLILAWRNNGQEFALWKIRMHFPGLRSSVTKILVSSADNLVVGLTLFVFLPGAHEVSFAKFLAYFLSAYLLALLSLIPAGWGVLEGVLLYLFRPYSSDTEIISGMVMFRLYHYLLPAAAGLIAVLVRKSYIILIAPRPTA
jgi:uncharacterized membrane protein YbhN (UPF0104 family)